jgi:hypothetical protein
MPGKEDMSLPKVAVVIATALIALSFQTPAQQNPNFPCRIETPNGWIDTCAGADLGHPSKEYQAPQSNWWSQDIVSSAVAQGTHFTVGQIASACQQADCVGQIREICDALKENEFEKWNPVEIVLGRKDLASITVNPVRLCNHPALRRGQ